MPGGTSSLLPALAPPKGGGAIRGIGEKFSVNAATGAGSLSVPLAVSPGRAGFGPQVELAYDSGAGNGPFGLGFSLSVPSISRKTDKGLPRYLDEDETDEFVLSGAEDLVPLRDEDGVLVEIERVLDGVGYRVRRYRPRVEGLFALIERWVHATSRDAHFRVTTKDNTTHVYGASAEARIADPDDGRRVFTWLLEESRDDKGNVVHYAYKAEDGAGVDPTRPSERSRFDYTESPPRFTARAQRYLKRVLYCNQVPFVADQFLMELVLDYGEHDPFPTTPAAVPTPEGGPAWALRQDAFSSYRAGFEVRTYRLCRRVLMFHHFSGPALLVKSTDFHHDPTPAFTYLTGVTQHGYLRNASTGNVWERAAMPTLELEYARPVLHDELRALPKASLEGLEGGVDGGLKQWVDLDGEGIPGVLIDAGDAWYYKSNLGDGELTPPLALASLPAPARLSGGLQQLEDLEGDGQLDLVAFEEPLAGYFARTPDGSFEPLRAFHSIPNVDFDDPNLRVIDLDGDGFPDLLITEDHAFLWYRSRGKQGFDPVRRLVVPTDDTDGPAIVFADPEQSIQLADMSGDGLVDIVRIRNGEVSYWPNLGYGRFGKKVTLEDSPVFATPDEFDARRVRFGDVDGSGTSDLFYLGASVTRLYFNQAGNSLSAPTPIRSLPPVDSLTSLSIVDLLGTGTAALVWSSPLPGARSIFYVDLLDGEKPHLLETVTNNLGAETTLTYAPSTKFYLEDKAAGVPWLTRLTFPVHVVERIERVDSISKSRLVTSYRYRHGFFDGVEREFRGFARVEQRDAEEFSAGTTETELFQAPVRTITWFHTGAWLEKERFERALAEEHFPAGPKTPADLALLFADTTLPAGLSIQEEREAARALRGRMLHQEVYAEDGTANASLPYLITEQSFEVQRIQPILGGKHGVFFAHPRESLAIHTERNPADPRIAHDLVLLVDEFGEVRRRTSITYPRRPLPERIAPEQTRLLATLTLADFIHHPAPLDPANEAPSTHWHRVGLEYQNRTYELTGLPALASGQVILPFESVRQGVEALLAAPNPANDLPFEDVSTATGLRRRLLDWRQQTFYADDLETELDLGLLESLAVPYQTYQLAFTAGLVTQIAGHASDLLQPIAVTAAEIDALLLDTSTSGGHYRARAGGYWTASGRVVFDPALAPQRFFLAEHALDAFGNPGFVSYDDFSLLVTSTRDALANTVRAENDYRVLAPRLFADTNLNRVEVAFDALGLLVRTAVRGKATESFGDDLDHPTTELVYDLLRFQQQGLPAFVETIAREEHLHQSAAPRFQRSFTYSDGFGRVVMQKVQAEPGPVPGVTGEVDARWVGTGRTVFNNKGNPVKQYEPFFSTTSAFEDEAAIVETGVTPILHYDPLDRVIRTELPDGGESRVEFDAWFQKTYDPNDAVLGTRWLTEHEGGTEDEQRAAELALAHADTPTTTHLDTLGRPFLVRADNGPDPTNPTGPHVTHDTRSTLDIEGNVLVITDALGVVTIQQGFDVLRRRIRVQSPDAGTRLAIADVASKPLRNWDQRRQTFRFRYDALQRQTHLFVRETAAAERLLLRTVFGEALDPPVDPALPPVNPPPAPSPAQLANLRGQPHQLYDCAGLVTHVEFDFKANLLRGVRRLAADFRTEPNWLAAAEQASPADVLAQVNALLEPEEFETASTYDALNRVTSHTTPDDSVTIPTYNEANLLEAVRVSVRGGPERLVVGDIDYNARGQRLSCAYVNPTDAAAPIITTITYTYDPDTFRLTELLTTRGTTKLQHLVYTYDPVGNIVALRDRADTAPFFSGSPPVSGDGLYVYDALYRLTEATGREHPGLQPVHLDPAPGTTLPHANDINALRAYTERYLYDEVGNIQRISHLAGPSSSGGWTRNYEYFPGTNRLRFTSVPGNELSLTEPYRYDEHGSMIQMPHLAVLHWDYADRLKRTEKAVGDLQDTHFAYDGAGQRVRKVFETTGTLKERIYLGGYELYRERANTPGSALALERQTLHVMDDTRRVAMVETLTVDDGAIVTTPESLSRFQLYNHLGSPAIELNEAGGVISYEEYHPYGSTAFRVRDGNAEVSAKRYRYTGKERDEETGLYYHGARYYAPWLGRWTAADPAGPRDTLNPYIYARNRPITLSDPTGFESEPTEAEQEAQASIPEEHLRSSEPTAPTPREQMANASLPAEHETENGSRVHPGNMKRGSSGVRLRADVPRAEYKNLIAREEAAQGRLKLAEIAEANLGCTFCHIVKDYSTRAEADAAIDLEHFNRIAVGMSLARDVTEILAGGIILKSAALAPGATATSAAPIAGGAEPGNMLFRGTTVGYPGNPSLQRIGVTPTSTDPAVATVFATEAATFGEGVVLIAPRSSVPLTAGNWLAPLEAEVGVALTPLEFAAQARAVSVTASRAALGTVGVEVPAIVRGKAALDATLRTTPKLTEEQIMQYLKALGQ